LRGIHSVDSQDFDPNRYFSETFKGGRLIGDRGLIRRLVSSTAEISDELREIGVPLRYHSRGAYVDSDEGRAGRTLTKMLFEYGRGLGIEKRDHTIVLDLLSKEAGIQGAIAFDTSTGSPLIISAPAIILATGGAGGIFLNTDNPRGISGDGYALSYLAGAPLLDLEFVQFLPVTAPPSPGSPVVPVGFLKI